MESILVTLARNHSHVFLLGFLWMIQSIYFIFNGKGIEQILFIRVDSLLYKSLFTRGVNAIPIRISIVVGVALARVGLGRAIVMPDRRMWTMVGVGAILVHHLVVICLRGDLAILVIVLRVNVPLRIIWSLHLRSLVLDDRGILFTNTVLLSFFSLIFLFLILSYLCLLSRPSLIFEVIDTVVFFVWSLLLFLLFLDNLGLLWPVKFFAMNFCFCIRKAVFLFLGLASLAFFFTMQLSKNLIFEEKLFKLNFILVDFVDGSELEKLGYRPRWFEQCEAELLWPSLLLVKFDLSSLSERLDVPFNHICRVNKGRIRYLLGCCSLYRQRKFFSFYRPLASRGWPFSNRPF